MVTGVLITRSLIVKPTNTYPKIFHAPMAKQPKPFIHTNAVEIAPIAKDGATSTNKLAFASEYEYYFQAKVTLRASNNTIVAETARCVINEADKVKHLFTTVVDPKKCTGTVGLLFICSNIEQINYDPLAVPQFSLKAVLHDLEYENRKMISFAQWDECPSIGKYNSRLKAVVKQFPDDYLIHYTGRKRFAEGNNDLPAKQKCIIC